MAAQVLNALQLNAEQLPTPRADGDREALRILLGARHDLTSSHTAQTKRLRALLLGGDDTDRRTARATLNDTVLAGLRPCATVSCAVSPPTSTPSSMTSFPD